MDAFAVGGIEGIKCFYINGVRTSIIDAAPYLDEIKKKALEKIEVVNVETCFSNCKVDCLLGLLTDFLPRRGSVLDIGYGLNTDVMAYFVNKGFDVSGIDIIKLPDTNIESHFVDPKSDNGVKKLMKTRGSVEYLTTLKGAKRYWGYFLDWDENKKADLLSFWGSWSSHSHNLTIGHTSKDYFFSDELRLDTNNPEERFAMLEHLIKKETLNKARRTLTNNGKIMIINPSFTNLGMGYLSSDDELIDIIELFKLLSETGYKKACVIGSFKKVKSKIGSLFADYEVTNPSAIIIE